MYNHIQPLCTGISADGCE
uniref:RepB n=1 Tax=Pantoea stewartii subsp. stewartii TaxID=66271 RepID=Q9EYW5_PANSE|nr:RepB [Pantoea stewartii subsp. stewartii]